MPSALVLAPLALAAVLALSGLAKVRDHASTLSVLRLLRLPAPLVQPWVATALPWGELALAALVIAAPRGVLTWIAAVATLGLMAAYWLVVARAMRFTPRPSCGCFGRIGDQTITERTLVRNTLLVALAVAYVVVALQSESTLHLLAGLGGAGWAWVVGAGVVGALAVLIFGRSGDRTHSHEAPAQAGRAAGASTGSTQRATDVGFDEGADEEDLEYVREVIPLANLLSPQGEPQTLRELASAKAQLLIAVNCYCSSTHSAIAALPRWREGLDAIDVRFVMATQPAPLVEQGVLDPDDVWHDHGAVAWNALGLTASPSAVLLGMDGMLAGGPVSGHEEIEEFVTEVREALSGVPAAR